MLAYEHRQDFLFKKGHLSTVPETEHLPKREDLLVFAQKSLPWIYEELEVIQPKLVIVLGSEPTEALLDIHGQKNLNERLNYKIETIGFGNNNYPTIFMAHPGIVMRKNMARNPWPLRNSEGIKRLKPEIGRLIQK